MQLSRNFYLSEFTKSQVAVRKEISNKPSKKVIKNLKRLCTNILQPLRDWFDSPIRINSGYRSPQLNTAIGGSTKSQHCKGEAADLEIDGISNKKVAEAIQEWSLIDQLILEFYNPKDPSSGWVHVSYKEKGNRNQVLRAVKVKGKTKYLEGLE